jgi:uncharacterized protein (DUF1800 family)
MSRDQLATEAALRRFGLGPRPGDLARVGTAARDLFRAEITGPAPAPLVLPHGGTDRIGPDFRAFIQAERVARELRASPLTALPAEQVPAGIPAPLRFDPPPQMPQIVFRAEAQARFRASAEPLGGFRERLVQFWSNHFCVAAGKGGPVRVMAGAFERECIRPFVTGRFADMLQAVESHPAMLVYLDNQLSVGPNSPAGRRRGRGLNENLAREILELHTLGVGGGYTQADVTSLARILTGWSLAPDDAPRDLPGTFRFNANLHEPGAHTVLGRSYGEDGVAQGRAVLDDLARHAATARHVAFKLARHFVADSPPPALVERLARVFRDTEGDLAAVALALLDAPEAWATPDAGPPAKLRTPQEFLVATLRALDLQPEIGRVLPPLRAMGQDLWNPPGPNGFPDTADVWAQSEGIKSRLDVAVGAARLAGGVDPRAFLADVLGPGTSSETAEAIRRAESRAQGLALALMSPEFQRR